MGNEKERSDVGVESSTTAILLVVVLLLLLLMLTPAVAEVGCEDCRELCSC